jgi:hypothetical protein
VVTWLPQLTAWSTLHLRNCHSFVKVRPKYNGILILILWHVDQLLGNDSVNTFPRQQMHRQQSDNFLCYATHCKHNRGRGVFYVVRIYPLLGNGCVFYGSASLISEVSRRTGTRMERVFVTEGRRVRLKIDCELLWLWLRETVKEGVNKYNHAIQNSLLLVTEP